MSYLSATENVGFSGIPQNISDASCATQYKMAVNGLEGVPANCAETMYIPGGEDQTYISHINDNYYTKFKIDPNELYTFHDSDVSEITVSHTEDTLVFPESVEEKLKDIDSPSNDVEIVGAFTNGDVKEEIKKKVLSNGHYNSVIKKPTQKNVKTLQTKVQKAKSQVKEVRRESVGEVCRLSVQSPNTLGTMNMSPPSTVPSINSVNTNSVPNIPSKQTSPETFLDVFKREQGLVENSVVKTEPLTTPPPPPPPPLMKIPLSPPKKISSGKTPSQPKPRRGRGPAMHEALQRISQRRAIAVPIKRWHAPDAFDCGPMSIKKPAYRSVDSSSEDDDVEMPEIEIGSRPLCIEEIAAESRNARIAFRKAAMRRQLHRAHETLRLAKRHSGAKAFLNIVKKQLNGTSGLPTQSVNHLLAMRGMPSLLTSEERRTLRDSGWSGGESGSCAITDICSEETCMKPSLPCGRYCLAHITLASEQKLYASCAAVFAVGSRCNYPLLPLKDQLPLCEEHAWKRDNYDKLIRDNKPKKVIRPRLLAAPRRPKRRRRPPPPRIRPPAPPPSLSQSLSEINVCSNSPAYESADDTQIGVMSENEYISVASNSHELEVEVVHDILDPSVLSQMPDEAFTEFFNQEESGSFGEGSELAAALEAVLDERGLDERALDETELDERELDERELDERELEERELDERELDGGELVDGELEEQVIEDETLHTMDDSMFAVVEDGCIDRIKMVPTSVSAEISTIASS